MILIAVLWGTAFPATRILLEEMPPLAAAAWRTVIAAVAVAAFAAWRGEAGRLWPRGAHRGRLGLMALLGGPGFLFGMTTAVGLTGASITSFVTGTYPLLAVLVAAIILGERMSRGVAVALGIVLVGMALLARPGGAHVEPLGVVLSFGAALSFATYLALTRRWSDPEHVPALTLGFWLLTSTFVVIGAAQLLVDPGELVPALSMRGLAALVWLALAAGALPHLLLIATMRRLPAGRAAPFLLLMPIVGSILSAILLNERLDVLQLGGAALMLVGIGAAVMPPVRRA